MKHTLLLTIVIVLSIIAFSQVAHATNVSIDHVTGSYYDGGVLRLIPNIDVDFYIRFTNNSGIDSLSFANGFRVWTTGGTPFTPLNGEWVYPEFWDLFDFGPYANVFSADGVGADTLGIAGTAGNTSGLYNGFDEIVLKLSTGGIQEGETLCIDSSFLPPAGTWLWVSSAIDIIIPSWSGQQCFTAECPACIGAFFTNCTDTLRTIDCATISYQFEASDSLCIPSGGIRFSLIDGPGTIDSITGEWSYNIPSNKLGTYDTLTIQTNNWINCLTSECWVVLDYTPNMPADMNGDCSLNISDLVFMVAYMFQNGSPPNPLLAADVNGDSNITITDLVYLVAFMFQGGPPPVG